MKLGEDTPDGVVETPEGVNLDTMSAGKLVGIEILQASVKMDLSTILNFRHILSHGFSRIKH